MAISNNFSFTITPTEAVHEKYGYVHHKGCKTLGDCLYCSVILNFKL